MTSMNTRPRQELNHRPRENLPAPLPRPPALAGGPTRLTSLHGTPGRGPYGRADYRGNCSGLLIRDILEYFQPRRVLDPMEGGGTCRDVCRELGLDYLGLDLHRGHDATDPAEFERLGTFDFVWMHPPYWQMIRYSDDARCLSQAATLRTFLERLRVVVRNCVSVLAPAGKLAILMGDGKHQGQYLGLPFRCLGLAVEEGLWLAAPEIIRFSHGASSSRKTYSGRIIPRLHDVCLILGRRGEL